MSVRTLQERDGFWWKFHKIKSINVETDCCSVDFGFTKTDFLETQINHTHVF